MDEEYYIKERKEKLEKIRQLDKNPFPYKFEVSAFAENILKKYKNIKEGEEIKGEVSVAGRIILFRPMGKVTFLHIQDSTGRIQIYLREDILKDNYKIVKLLDIGDWVGVKGYIFKTQKGEVSVKANYLEVLCKSLRPLPEKFHGLKDIETKYRKRYLDLITNPESREVFLIRSRFISAIREYLEKEGFIEFETPTLQPIYGGARAKPFITHHNELNMKLYLRISNELYLKRLLIAGFNKVYEFVKDFRNEGIDTNHNPEFTQVEWYEAFTDYEKAMKLFEIVVAYAAKKAVGKTKVKFMNHEIELKPPWKRLSMTDAIKKYAKIDVSKMSEKELEEFMNKNNIEKEPCCNSWGLMVERIFEELCEKHLIEPVFIINHPTETTPLCKELRGKDKRFIERAEPYIGGMEVGNIYSELNDSVLQRRLLEQQVEQRKRGDVESHPMDEDFVEALEYGMPPASGVGMGVDRMIMIITDSPSIRDVILFPTMKPK